MKRWSFGWKRIAGTGAIVALCAFAFVWFGMLGAPLGQQPNTGKASSPQPATLLAGDEATADSGDGSAEAGATGEGSSAEPFGGAPYEQGVVLVSLEEGANPDQAIAQLAADTGLSGLAVQDAGEGYALLALPEGVSTEQAVNAINASDVAAAQPNFIYELQDDATVSAGDSLSTYAAGTIDMLATQAMPNDPDLGQQWGLESINVFSAWDKVAMKTGSNIGVAILDEGFNLTHEDLPAPVATYNSVTKTTDVSPSTEGGVDIGHGTHVAGIVGAVANNGKGIAGVADNHADLVLVKVFGLTNTSSGRKYTATSATLTAAYDYLFTIAKERNIRVVNCSVGMTKENLSDEDKVVHDRIDKAFNTYNMVTVCSAGNSGNTSYNFPSDYETAVSVMSLERVKNADGTYGVKRLASSSYNASTNTPDGPGKNICAPGAEIYSTCWSNSGSVDNAKYYKKLNGSSMAAPHVAAVLALMFIDKPNLTAAEAVSRLYQSATDLGAEGWDPDFGYGEVNALAALNQDAISLKDAHVSWPACTYTGKTQNPTPVVKVNGVALQAGTDFTVSYPKDAGAYVAGDHTVTINASSAFYTGSTSSTYTIAPADIADAQATLAETSYKYDGKAKEPKVTSVTFGDRTLNKGVDFTVSYKDNKEAGTAKAVLTGMRNFTGTKEIPFQITDGNNNGGNNNGNGGGNGNNGGNNGYSDDAAEDIAASEGYAAKSSLTDLDKGDWYMQAGDGKGSFPGTQTLFLDYTLAQGLMNGYRDSDGVVRSFGPNSNLTRAESATIIYRLANPGSVDTTDPAHYATENTTGLPDVEVGKYYTAAVNWCVKNNIVTGYKNDAGQYYAFGPNDNITREQIATIIARYRTTYLGKPTASADIAGYGDYAKIGTWARSGVSYCLSKGIMSGYAGSNTFGPQDLATRAQMAKIIAVTATAA